MASEAITRNDLTAILDKIFPMPKKYSISNGDVGTLANELYNYLIVEGNKATICFWVNNLPTSASGEPCIVKFPSQYAPSHNVYFAPAYTLRTVSAFSSYAYVSSSGQIKVGSSVVTTNTQILGTCTWYIGM